MIEDDGALGVYRLQTSGESYLFCMRCGIYNENTDRIA